MFKLTWKNICYLLLYSIPHTILSFGIIYIINKVTSGEKYFLTDYTGIVFMSFVIYSYLLNVIFQKKLNEYSFEILYENEKKIFDKILKTPLITLEKLGTQRFYTAIEDLRIFSSMPEVITHSINSILMLLICMLYLFTVSIYSALVVVAVLVLILIIYFFSITAISKKVVNLRECNEDYYKYVDDVIKGFKALKINGTRRQSLMNNYLSPNRESAKKLDTNINYISLSINLISQYGLYLVIGIVLFLLPEIGFLKRENVVFYVVILLFLSEPINNLINMQNIYSRLGVANIRIKKFMKDFDDIDTDIKDRYLLNDTFNFIDFNNISFSHKNKSKDEIFTLGPLDLSIQKGQVVFITGGNGSGKSTFINILTGLYEPSEGEILLNNKKINSAEEIQNFISAVFTDNHIFSFNYDEYSIQNNLKYDHLLKIMKLDEIIVDNKEESIRRSFSKGQSKRVSLIFALLENKPLLILDEWAADQDPHFRKYFYEDLLPYLKEEGKTIIAVTHDDAYFKYADRVIKFDYGKISKDFQVKNKILKEHNFWE